MREREKLQSVEKKTMFNANNIRKRRQKKSFDGPLSHQPWL